MGSSFRLAGRIIPGRGAAVRPGSSACLEGGRNAVSVVVRSGKRDNPRLRIPLLPGNHLGEMRFDRCTVDFRAATIAVASLAVLLTACSGSSSPNDRAGSSYRVTERILAPGGLVEAQAPDARSPEARTASIVEWTFDSDERASHPDFPAWAVVRHAEDVRVESGALVFRSTGNDCQMVLKRDLSFLELGKIEVTMQTEGASVGSVFWSPPGTVRFDAQRTRTFRLKKNKRRFAITYTIDLGSLTSGELAAGAIRLDPVDAPGEVRIDSIRLLPPDDNAVRGFLETRRLGLRRTYRAGTLFTGSYAWTDELDLPDDARLRFHLGAAKTGEPMDFRLEVGTEEDPAAHRAFRVRTDDGKWIEKTVSVGELRAHGNRVTLRAEGHHPDRPGMLGRVEVLEPEPAERKAPNLLLIVIDTLRADRLSCYGYDASTSPRIDRFAEGAVRFENAIPQCSWTLPSVASILSSRYPAEIQVQWGRNYAIPADVRMPAEVLREDGFSTACVFGNGILDIEWGFERGFDMFTLANGLELTADEITDRALDWLDTHRDDRFFLYLHYIDPHDGYEPPAAKNPFVRGEKDAVPATRIDDLFTGKAELEGPEELEQIRRLYDGEVFFADREIGRVLDRLDRSGLAEDTIVVMTSDHGEELLEHGGWRHGLNLYAEQARVPLLIRYPDGRFAGRVIDSTVELLDVMPTLLDAAGLLEDDAPYSGRSLMPLLEGKEQRGPAFAETRANGPRRLAVTDGTWKLIRFDKDEPYRRPSDTLYQRIIRDYEATELYEIRQDPTEHTNRADAEPAHVERLGALLDEFVERTRANASVSPQGMDRETRERLRRLGYIVPDEEEAPGSGDGTGSEGASAGDEGGS